MEPITGAEILSATGGKLLQGDVYTTITRVTTDSRGDCTGALFIPLTGERFNGHDFIPAAASGGAAAVLTQEALSLPPDILAIQVPNTLTALQALAKYYRSKFDIPVIGITGSVGKTTTKDMVAAVLSTSYNCLKTQGNFNNEIGLPLTMFQLERSHQVAVIEIGMSGFHEIDRLADIAQPDCAVITNIGMSHIEKLGSQENILKAKMEILDHLTPGGCAILNGDDPLLWGIRSRDGLIITVGMHNDRCDILARDVKLTPNGSTFRILTGGLTFKVTLNVPGEHNIYHAMTAAAIAVRYHVPLSGIIKGLEEFQPSDMRMELTKKEGYTVINDCYNASPDSMYAAIDVLTEQPGSRTIAVLGDMLEMGAFAYQAHKDVGSYVRTNRVDELITVGENARSIGEGAFECGMDSSNIHAFDTTADACKYLFDILRTGDVILVKASRGMHFEEISNRLLGR